MPGFTGLGLVGSVFTAKENYGLIITASNSDEKTEQKQRTVNRNLISNLFKSNNITPYELVNPTKNEFENKVKEIKDKSKEDNVTYIYINCHGSESGLWMLLNNGKTFCFSYKELKAKLDTIKGKKVLIIDSCHSGSSITEVEDLVIVNSSLFNTSQIEGSADTLSGDFRTQDYFVITSCSANELSWRYDNGSYFTRCMCAAVGSSSKRPAAKIDKKYVTLSEICRYTRNNKEKDHTQIDYCYPDESEFPVFGNSIIHANSTYYLVEIKVPDISGAGTDANIYIRFIGDKGSSNKYLLDHEIIDDFKRNSINKYMIKCNNNIGNLQKVEISSDNTEDEPEFLMQYIKVTDTGRNISYKTTTCLTSYWIDRQHSSRTFNVKEIGHTYKITISIGNEDGAGTDSNVCVQFVGTNGSSSPYLLDSDIDDFERGTSLTYKVKTDVEIGTLQSVVITSDNSGKTPEFHIIHVAVEDTADNKRYSSSDSVWYNSKNLRHTFYLKQNNNMAYLVNIKIANANYAGTDANIYLRLIGSNGSSRLFLLDTPDKDDFERNTYNLFNLTADNIGELKKVYIKNGNEGKGADMKIDNIEITDRSINKKYRAACNCWVDSSHGLEKSFDLVAQ